MNLFSEKELLVMAIVVGGLLVVIIGLTILDIKDYLKNKKKRIVETTLENETKEFEVEEVVVNNPPENSMTRVLEEIEVLDFDEPVLVKKEGLNQVSYAEENSYVSVSNEKEEAIRELERVTLELEMVDNKDPFEDTITNFEIEQEENAIISLDELTKISNNLYDSNEYIQYDDGNEPITIDEVINKYNYNLQTEVDNTNNVLVNNVMDDIVPKTRMERLEYEMAFENTANFDKLDMEMRRTNDFLNSLNELYEKQN